MEEQILKINGEINKIVWGPPVLFLIVGTGIVLCIITGFIIYTRFGHVMKNTFGKVFDKSNKGKPGLSPFQAVSTALAATIGTGNIAGVATALASGGPGALFWMWIAAVIGLTTKFAEVTLSLAYREKNVEGEWVGGPMYYIQNGLGWKWLAKTFALFGALAAFGIGSMVQSNSIAIAMNQTFGVDKLLMGIILAVVAGVILIGGIKRIGQFAEKVVPFMAIAYVIGALAVLFVNRGNIGHAFNLIFTNAFKFEAVGGGFLGHTIGQAMRYGIARGVFTNEAGLGSAPIAHAASNIDHPVRQGLWGSFEVFVDTLIVATMTGLVILTSKVGEVTTLTGSALTTAAFKTGFGAGEYVVTLGILLFAFTTIVGWCYYGEKCVEYLLGTKVILPYRIVYIVTVVLGAIGALTLVWELSDTLNGLMAIPNLIALIALSKVVASLTKDYFSDPGRIRTSPDEYDDKIKWAHKPEYLTKKDKVS